MANEQNLRVPTSEEAREIGRKGGVASGKARRQKKTLKQIGDVLGNLPIASERNKEVLRQAGITDDELLINDTIGMYNLMGRVIKGDPKAMETWAKLRGQFKEQISAEVAEVKPLVDLTKRKKNGEKK